MILFQQGYECTKQFLVQHLKDRKEQAEQEEAKREQAEKEQAERETAEKEQTEKEQAEREQAEKEKEEIEQAKLVEQVEREYVQRARVQMIEQSQSDCDNDISMESGSSSVDEAIKRCHSPPRYILVNQNSIETEV